MPVVVMVGLLGSILLQKKINQHQGPLNYEALDVLKVMLALIILVMHLRPFMNYSNTLDIAFNNMLSRFCVPVFFVITGYFVAKKDENYISSYIKKTIPLYLVWSFIYLPLLMVTFNDYAGMIAPYLEHIQPLLLVLLMPVIVLVLLFYTGTYYHLWYFPALLLSLLVLDGFRKRWDVKYLFYLSFGLLLFGATETYFGVLPTSIQEFLKMYYNLFYTTRNFLFFGLFYVLMGYQMAKRPLDSTYCFYKLIGSFVLLFCEVMMLYPTQRLNSNILLSSVPLSYYLFVSVIHLPKNKVVQLPWRELSKYYYLVHPMMISILLTFATAWDPFLQVFVLILLTHVISMALISLKAHRLHPWLDFL